MGTGIPHRAPHEPGRPSGPDLGRSLPGGSRMPEDDHQEPAAPVGRRRQIPQVYRHGEEGRLPDETTTGMNGPSLPTPVDIPPWASIPPAQWLKSKLPSAEAAAPKGAVEEMFFPKMEGVIPHTARNQDHCNGPANPSERDGQERKGSMVRGRPWKGTSPAPARRPPPEHPGRLPDRKTWQEPATPAEPPPRRPDNFQGFGPASVAGSLVRWLFAVPVRPGREAATLARSPWRHRVDERSGCAARAEHSTGTQRNTDIGTSPCRAATGAFPTIRFPGSPITTATTSPTNAWRTGKELSGEPGFTRPTRTGPSCSSRRSGDGRPGVG